MDGQFFHAPDHDDRRARPDQADVLHAYRLLHALERDGADGSAILRHALRSVMTGRLAAVSSFGAESVVLLSMIADIDPSLPVGFLDTGKHFPETIAYRDEAASLLGLRDVRDVVPAAPDVAGRDPTGELWYFDPDACCSLRKVEPLEDALAGFDGWISGRKRHQAVTRHALPLVELDGGRVKLNPLADWDAARIRSEMARRRLPAHPLVGRGYASIGCSVCTRATGASEHERSGRWAGLNKTECGIHRMPATT